MKSGFQLFAAAHLVALAALGALGLSAVVMARAGAQRTRRTLRLTLACSLASCHVIENVVALAQGWYKIQMLPLEMCDLAALFGVYGLLTRDERVVGPAWFFALSGTLPALITPELNVTFPHFRFVIYFLEHGLTVITSLVLVLGLGVVPRAGAWLRAFLIINAFGLLNGLLNAILGTNFMYLSHKPASPTPFDWFGPWPFYLFVLELLVIALFRLLQLPLAALEAAGAQTAGGSKLPAGAAAARTVRAR